MYLKCTLANVVTVEESSNSTAANDTAKQTEAVTSTDKPTNTTCLEKSESVVSAVKSRKRKAILLPDDYHDNQSKIATRKAENGMF